MSPPEASQAERGLLPGMDAPVFAEPWQAQAFAITVALNEAGAFSWTEWAAALSAELDGPGGIAADGEGYYACWLAALERLLAHKSIAGRDETDVLAQAWQRAAHATPHGQPILLENDPFFAGSAAR